MTAMVKTFKSIAEGSGKDADKRKIKAWAAELVAQRQVRSHVVDTVVDKVYVCELDLFVGRFCRHYWTALLCIYCILEVANLACSVSSIFFLDALLGTFKSDDLSHLSFRNLGVAMSQYWSDGAWGNVMGEDGGQQQVSISPGYLLFPRISKCKSAT